MRSIAVVLICMAYSGAAPAADLSKIDRTIRKERVFPTGHRGQLEAVALSDAGGQ